MSAVTETVQPRLRERYESSVRRELGERLGLSNVMQVPRLDKIVINMGVGRATQQQSLLEGAVRDLEVIAGQRPVVTKARRSIAGFKLRQGQSIGCMVTLRGDRMWEFLDRLISLAIPRVRDFRGLSPRSFDGHGNYTFGVTEQLIFPEIDYDKVDTTRGMDITIVTTARTDDEGRALLEAFGFPFRREGQGAGDGEEGTDREAAAHPEVQGSGLHPVPPVRSTALGVPQVRPVPDLPARAGSRRGGPRGHQGELVRGGITR